jgi:hypothetical protein
VEITHFLTTRAGGFSNSPYDSLNLGFHVGDDPEKVVKNRKRLAARMEIPLSGLTVAQQIHSGNVTVVTRRLKGKGCKGHHDAIKETDAMVTDVTQACLVVLVADCVPILFFDPSKKVIGAAHAGWKGTLQSIASKTVRVLEEAFGSSPSDMMVGMGPSIGPCCYRVGVEVASRADDRFPDQQGYMVRRSEDGSGHLDLWEANLGQLLSAGIKKDHVEMARRCTCHNPDLFFSYRHQKGNTGRFAAGIMLR